MKLLHRRKGKRGHLMIISQGEANYITKRLAEIASGDEEKVEFLYDTFPDKYFTIRVED